MKKKIIGVGIIICIGLLVCLGIIMYRIHQKDTRQTGNVTGTTVTEQTNTEQTDTTEQASKDAYPDYTQPIEKDEYVFEILDYQYVDKLQDYPGYSEEYMYFENIPEEGTDIRMQNQVDYESVYKEAPEFEKVDKGLSDASIEEQYSIIQDTQPIVDKYTTQVEVPYDYLFLHCRLTNQLDRERRIAINDQRLAIVKNGTWNYIEDHLIDPVYFDQSPLKNTNSSFFIIDAFGANETLEFTIAYAIPEDNADGSYYVGAPDPINDAEGNPQNPTEQTMYMRHLFER